MNTYEQKIEAKRERYKRQAVKNRLESDARYNTAHKMSDAIPFGQPILVGHHSEKADRNYRKRMVGNLDKAFEADKKARYYEEKAGSVGTGGISSDDPEAIAKLKEQLAKLEAAQEKFKAINKALKKKDDEVLKTLGLSENAIIELKKPGYDGMVGIPGYTLTNNSANIRRIKTRIEQLDKVKDDVTTTKTIGDVEIIDNVEENRLQIFFPSKPDGETMKRLKQGGFRWSPTNRCWQRHRGPGTRYSLDYILKLGSGKEGKPCYSKQAP